MKALTITEPWATLIAIGAKRIETRSWPTDYRGPVAIHASKKITSAEVELAIAQDEPIAEALARHGIQIFWQPGITGHTYQAFSTTRGCVIATGRLTGCIAFTQESVRKICAVYGAHELDFGDLTVGRFGFVLSDITPLPKPIPAKGALGFWEWESPAEFEVKRDLCPVERSGIAHGMGSDFPTPEVEPSVAARVVHDERRVKAK